MVRALDEHPVFAPRKGPIVLCILDGVGLGGGGEDDAVASARTPTLDRLMASCPHMRLRAHGTAVGMPSDRDLGNSEVGHNAMGAGRIFDQGAKLVDHALESGKAFTGEVWNELVSGKTLHLIGLLSDGNVHSHVDHLNAIIDRAAADGVKRLRVHVLTDGRDVDRRSALTWVKPLEKKLADMGSDRDYAIASGGGRMVITMDRYEADWPMVKRGWDCHVHGQARAFASASEAIQTAYDEDPEVDDQYIPPFVVAGSEGTIGNGDAVLFFNFRGDRAIEISRAFEEDDFDFFDRGDRPDVFYAGMMQYDGDLAVPKSFLVEPPDIDETVGEYLAVAKRRTFACSETQKYGHVTYFYNGNRSGYIDERLETYLEVPSDVVPFDERPWMKAAEISDAAVRIIGAGEHDVIRLNYANGDMVGHTGDLEATRIALEVVDRQLARLERAIRDTEGVLLITADHGNADEMYTRKKGKIVTNEDGSPMPRTSHTTNEVPLVVVDALGKLDVCHDVEQPGIANLGATVLELCGLKAPDDYLPGLLRVRT
ncbi:MAG TPA: 2,3-bisphosphoglycerate-independent phosphoglycerate mutase [Polyangiaceae bacterium]|nr:2,3-bisphosphoglycerate-independent phosphoglycerate mutase [Polyangiaceae bacterium]